MSSLFVRWLGDGFDPKSPMTRRINGVCTHANGSEKTHTKNLTHSLFLIIVLDMLEHGIT